MWLLQVLVLVVVVVVIVGRRFGGNGRVQRFGFDDTELGTCAFQIDAFFFELSERE